MYQLLVSGSVAGLLLQVLPIACLTGAVYAVYRCARRRKRQITGGWGKEALRWLFVCYLAGLVNLTLVPANLWSAVWALVFTGHNGAELSFFSGGFNFVPSLLKYLAGELALGSWVKTMLLGNFLMFLPMGVFLPLVFPTACGKQALKIAAAVPLAIELFQPVVGRSFDVDDLILNFLGILLGYALAAGGRNLCKRAGKRRKNGAERER